jgi:HEAT repeats
MATDTAPVTFESTPAPTLAPVELFLQRLARAVYQFRIYPSASPFRTEAIAAAQASLVAIEGRDRLVLRMTHRDLILDETRLGRDALVERELVRRLHGASIGQLTIRCDATAEDLSQFCAALALIQPGGQLELVDLLLEAGVARIEAEPLYRPEVVELIKDTGPALDRVRQQRARPVAAADAQPVHHLYPPDRGWIRVDPSSTVPAVSLSELAVLVEDPSQLAGILLRLTGDDADATADPQTALAWKYGDLATVFASLEPELARVMFGRLARAVLQLDQERRDELLKQAVLPGLLDGNVEGRILQNFPDVDLADALCLLLDLDTAVPEVLTVALDRLQLPAERRRTLAPLLRDRLEGAASAEPRQPHARALDQYARHLVKVSVDQPRDFTEFAAFDTALDEAARGEIAEVRRVAGAPDVREAQLRCLCGLIRLEASAERVGALLDAVMVLVGELQDGAAWGPTVAWLTELDAISAATAPRRPQVALRIGVALAAYLTPARARQLVDLYASDAEARSIVTSYLGVTAAAAAGAFVDLLDDRRAKTNLSTLADLICDHAARLAPGLVGRLDLCGPVAARLVVRALGHAGCGYEAAVAAELGHGDPLVRREALYALARIGTREAAATIAARLLAADPAVQNAAAESLWHLPPAEARVQLHHLLRHPRFAVQHPDVVLHLLTRAEATGLADFRAELARLARLRWHFWRPSLVRMAVAARQHLAS